MKRIVLVVLIALSLSMSANQGTSLAPNPLGAAITTGPLDGAMNLGRALGIINAPRVTSTIVSNRVSSTVVSKDYALWMKHLDKARKYHERLDPRASMMELHRAIRFFDGKERTDHNYHQALLLASEVSRELGRYREARGYLRQYVSLLEPSQENSLKIASAKNTLASIRLQQADHSKEVVKLINEAEILLRDCTGVMHSERANIYHNRAMIHHYRDEYHPALKHYLLALTIRQQTLGENSPITAESYGDLGLLFAEWKYPEQGESLVKRAIEIYEDRCGQHHPWAAWYKAQLAYLHLRQGKVAEAKEGLSESLHSRRKVLGTDSLVNRRSETYIRLINRLQVKSKN